VNQHPILLPPNQSQERAKKPARQLLLTSFAPSAQPQSMSLGCSFFFGPGACCLPRWVLLIFFFPNCCLYLGVAYTGCQSENPQNVAYIWVLLIETVAYIWGGGLALVVHKTIWPAPRSGILGSLRRVVDTLKRGFVEERSWGEEGRRAAGVWHLHTTECASVCQICWESIWFRVLKRYLKCVAIRRCGHHQHHP